jgi:putative aminopeptidase FrvX
MSCSFAGQAPRATLVSHAMAQLIPGARLALLGLRAWGAPPGGAPPHAARRAPPRVATDSQALRAADAVADWIALDAPPGHERVATTDIAAATAGWTSDDLGNLVLRRGHGTPRRVVACGLDYATYAVSEITGEGYLRLRTSGVTALSPLWDQLHEGQRVRVLTHAGVRPAVIGVRSVHLTRGRPGGAAQGAALLSVADLWVDVGARSRREAAALGVAMLDPVLREWPRWRYADLVAGPAAADRAGCAAVAGSAGATPVSGETIWVVSVQRAFGYAGLSAVLARTGPIDSLYVVDRALAHAPSDAPATASANTPNDTLGKSAFSELPDSVIRRPMAVPFPLPVGARAEAAVAIGIPVRFPGTLSEVVRGVDVVRLMDAVAQASGIAHAAEPMPLPAVRRAGAPVSPMRDSLTPVAELLRELSDIYATSGHESAMRDAVRASIPDRWARQRPIVDSAGNLIVAAGPERDTVVIVAHQDEIGFDVARITHDGTVMLRPRGGFFRSLWEGQPALLHISDVIHGVDLAGVTANRACVLSATGEGAPRDGAIRGLFIPRPTSLTSGAPAAAPAPDTLSAWFGVDSAGLVGCGVMPGLSVTGVKRATRLGAVRISARALDDRAGCTAVLFALRAIDPAALTHKVVFVWSVREEIGLDGAAAVAAELGPSVRRVYAIDTFVSSDSPLDDARFAYAPLGAGAAVRALDNSSVTPPAEVARVAAIAAESHIPLQIGTTNGGNDGSEFVRYGAIDVPLGWPLRYSHSPAEVADLRDIHALSRLIAAVVTGRSPGPSH